MNARVLAMALLAVLLSGNCMAVPQTREDCRASQLQSEVVSCIERGLYDPCDDGGGSWGRAQCAWAWTEVAERRVAKAEREILARLGQSKATTPALAAFRRSQGIWRSYRDSHCRFADATVDLEQSTKHLRRIQGSVNGASRSNVQRNSRPSLRGTNEL